MEIVCPGILEDATPYLRKNWNGYSPFYYGLGNSFEKNQPLEYYKFSSILKLKPYSVLIDK